MFKDWIVKHAPEIFAVTGVTALVATAVTGVFTGVKIEKKLNSEKERLGRDLTKKEVAKIILPRLAPVTAVAAVGGGAIIAGNRTSNARNVALAAAYTSTEAALTAYKTVAPEVLSATDNVKLGDAVVSKLAEDTTKANNGEIKVINAPSEDGDVLFYDPESGRYFYSNWTKLELAQVKLQKRATDYGEAIKLNDFYDEIDISRTEQGEVMGWKIWNNQIIEIRKDVVSIPEIDRKNNPIVGNNIGCSSFEFTEGPYYLLK